MPILEVEHLNKTFAGNSGEEFHALTDVSFSIEEGECMGLIGESGSGKSTIANIVAGFTPATGGSVRYDGYLLTDRRSGRICFRICQTDADIQIEPIIHAPAAVLKLCQP